ncbi:hypothetical protein ACCT14_01610 [Rhizobium brockwellii]|jgi:hypothetical protein|uniref:Uncharacterized protein n=1 Tax=Rhizobium brockwellii TaxID=3019932 RepID=A0ABU3YEG4_9HYPH|nr:MULTISPECIES: hypothetical protein [Rhizobium]MDV4177257.1 hypothetical protein [Rhizobium brockwellii]MDV4184256.1 hypothetical protein [Rhizobium brockwellii]NZD50325.1 hypothetical protein [Rhizobium leguminosarum]QIO50951.1 hypothetical protein HA461_07105 [Rhizobium leguminosarum bv. trifolii]
MTRPLERSGGLSVMSLPARRCLKSGSDEAITRSLVSSKDDLLLIPLGAEDDKRFIF